MLSLPLVYYYYLIMGSWQLQSLLLPGGEFLDGQQEKCAPARKFTISVVSRQEGRAAGI